MGHLMTPDRVRFPDFETRTMANGLRVMMMPIDKMPLVSVKCLIKSGSTSVEKGKSGSALLTLELLKKGCGKYSADKFSEAIDFLGGQVNTGAAPDYSIISADFLQKDLKLALHFVGSMVMKPHFSDPEFYAAQQRVSAAIKGIKDNPSSLSAYFFQTYFYGFDHPYGNPENGILREIHALQPEDIRSFYIRHIIANNAVLVLTGKFQIEGTFEKIADIFSSWHTGEIHEKQRITIPLLSQNRLIVLDKSDAVQTDILMGVPGIYQNHPDTIPILVANSLFGGGFTSRLNLEIRVKRSLTYSISSGFTRMFHQGAFTIGTSTKTESTGEMIRIIFEELDRLRSDPPSDVEIRESVRYLCGSFPLSLETAEQLSAKLTRMALYDLPADWVNDYIPSLKAVTVPDISTILPRYFLRTGYTCILSGIGKEIESQIKVFGDITMISGKDIHL